MTKPASTLLATALALLATAGAALAHAHLKKAVPPADGTVQASPAEIDLTFSEALELKFSGVKVTGPGGKAVETGAPTQPSGDGTTMVVPLAAPLEAGSYTVAWRILSTDGHKTSGSYTFTVAP